MADGNCSPLHQINRVTACQCIGNAIIGAMKGMGFSPTAFMASLKGGVSGSMIVRDSETNQRFEIIVRALPDEDESRVVVPPASVWGPRSPLSPLAA